MILPQSQAGDFSQHMVAGDLQHTVALFSTTLTLFKAGEGGQDTGSVSEARAALRDSESVTKLQPSRQRAASSLRLDRQ